MKAQQISGHFIQQFHIYINKYSAIRLKICAHWWRNSYHIYLQPNNIYFVIKLIVWSTWSKTNVFSFFTTISHNMIWIDMQNVIPRLNSHRWRLFLHLRNLNFLQLHLFKIQFKTNLTVSLTYICIHVFNVGSFFPYEEVISFSIALNIISWLALPLVKPTHQQNYWSRFPDQRPFYFI